MCDKRALTVLITLLISMVSSHSWVEQLTVIAANGTFVGAPGYPRGNVLRTSPGFSDSSMVYLIPPDSRGNNSILPTDSMCKGSQQTPNVTDGSPRLQATPGAAVALRYQENGHVTLPQNQPGKPPNRGTVYVYGTSDPRENDTLLAIHHVWNSEGTGGDKRGVLLSVQNFDDGRCYQINNGNISTERQAKFPHQPNQLMGANLWCQQDIALPSSLTSGEPYTLYWVWDWPTLPHIDPNLPNGKNETYTTCMDIDIANTGVNSVSHATGGYIEDQPLDSAAIPAQFAELTQPSPSNESSSVLSSTPSSVLSTPSSVLLTPSVLSTSSALSTPPYHTKQPAASPIVVTFVLTVTADPYGETPVKRDPDAKRRLPPKPRHTIALDHRWWLTGVKMAFFASWSKQAQVVRWSVFRL